MNPLSQGAPPARPSPSARDHTYGAAWVVAGAFVLAAGGRGGPLEVPASPRPAAARACMESKRALARASCTNRRCASRWALARAACPCCKRCDSPLTLSRTFTTYAVRTNTAVSGSKADHQGCPGHLRGVQSNVHTHTRTRTNHVEPSASHQELQTHLLGSFVSLATRPCPADDSYQPLDASGVLAAQGTRPPAPGRFVHNSPRKSGRGASDPLAVLRR